MDAPNPSPRDPAKLPDCARPVPESSGRTYQPKALLFSMLSVLWIFPSVGALCIVAPGLRSALQTGSVGAAVSSLGLEHWVALLLLSVHPAFVWQARRLKRNETPRPVPDDKEVD